MPTPAFNKEPVWFRPRNFEEDQVCYYIKDGRKTKSEIALHTAHPWAAREPIFEDMVFLYREPYGDRTGTAGDLVRDWYGPLVLLDPVTHVTDEGRVYQSAIMYARGTTAPIEDTRLDVKGRLSSSVGFTAGAWIPHPDIPGLFLDLVELTIIGVTEFTGDEVYLEMTAVGTLGGITDGPAIGDVIRIARHIDSQTVQIEVPYDVSVTPGGVLSANAYEACYLLDGWSDSENAPGVLGNLYHMRRFTYRLAEKSVVSAWDESLGLLLQTENMLVPDTWAENIDGTTTSTADENSSVSYEVVSKRIARQTKRGIADGAAAEQDGLTWVSEMRIQLPAILREFNLPYSYAYAQKDEYRQYDQRFGIDKDALAPVPVPVASRHVRRVVLEAQVSATIAAQKALVYAPVNPYNAELFSFEPKTYSFVIQGYWHYVGSNTYARAMVIPVTLGPYLLGAPVEAGSGDTFLEAALPTSAYAAVNFGTTNPDSSTGGSIYIDGTNIKILDDNAPPWGIEVLWDIKVQKARHGYWMIDFVYVTLPANPGFTPTP